MQLFIETQHHENYGAHDWDGQGTAPQCWKAKGGDTVVVTGIEFEEFELERAETTVEQVRSQIEQNDDYFQIEIIAWSLKPTGTYTHEEVEAMAHTGRVDHPSKRVSV